MLFDSLFLILIMAFIVHILIIAFYFATKSVRLFYSFLATAFLNIILGMVIAVVAFRNPGSVRNLNLGYIFWIISGFLFVIMLVIQLYIIVKIFRRKNDPTMYHLNYFGKKVYHTEVVKKQELAAIYLSIPFFLIFGAYFISKTIAMFF